MRVAPEGNMEPGALDQGLFRGSEQCRHYQPTSRPTSCCSPRYSQTRLNKTLDTDSGILSSCSSRSSSEIYSMGKGTSSSAIGENNCATDQYGIQLERDLQLNLLESESRRCALSDSLKTACCALKEQREQMSKKNMEVINHSAIIDKMILKQKLLETKVKLLHEKEGTQKGVKLDEAEREREFQDRIWCLEEEIENINLKLEQMALKKRTTLSPISCYLGDGRNEAKEQPPNYLHTLNGSLAWYRDRDWNLKEKNGGVNLDNVIGEGDLQEIPSCLVSAETGRASIENQMADLHSELFQTKCESYGLKKQYLKSESQLTANRNINESLLLEVTRLKQSLQASEQQMLKLQSEKEILTSRLKTLECERQQIFNQKELLLKTLKKLKCHKHEDSLLQINSDDSISIYRTPSINLQECPSKLCAQCECLSKEPELAKDEDKLSVHQEQMEHGGECLTDGSNSVMAPGTELLSTETEEIGLQSKKIIPKINQATQENTRLWTESKDSDEGLQQQNADLTKTHGNINLQFEKLLEKIEGFVKLSLKLEIERNQTVCKLRMQTTEIKNLEVSSVCNRKLLLHLLSKNIHLRHDNQLKANQLTVLIIGLHHLRNAYQALSQNVDHPEGNSSADWINRLQLIKDIIEKFKIQQKKLKLLEEENELLAQKSSCESLRNMEAKVTALQKDILKMKQPWACIRKQWEGSLVVRNRQHYRNRENKQKLKTT
ncbi:uncharacterized protein LOC122539437 isoform X3 [Chiloscyllium plagiosum]|uniref:uncharacterized protein LOC122539437 isoform X3 n=1 Tax=Chiloscyllium plagiosum TaxID=36176 RepID=UPI001CB868FF|nr:uncharacterized protein LOC122539437 isoform X3 [Chiloscyllium plagiosum]